MNVFSQLHGAWAMKGSLDLAIAWAVSLSRTDQATMVNLTHPPGVVEII